jgi:hydroxymethylglutaryl-CoA lyase
MRARDVTIVEVGPRDGLQNEAAEISTDVKVAFIGALAAAGLPVVECGAFVHPGRVPRMADSDDVCRRAAAHPAVTAAGTRLTALVPNLRGLERAMAAGLSEIAVFAAASETFSRRNLNQSIETSLSAYAEVCAVARASAMRVRGYVSTVFGCPYEGTVAVHTVRRVAEALLAMGADEVVLSDTIGVAHPGQVRRMLADLREHLPWDQVALHMHDTRGTALANVLVALDADVRTFDASAGGLGGCPFAPGAAGNLATEDLVYMLDGLGLVSGVSLAHVAAASRALAPDIGHPLPSRMLQALSATR